MKKINKGMLQDRAVVNIWDGAVPAFEKEVGNYTIIERSKNPFLPDRAIIGITNPCLTVFKAEHPNGTTIIVAPGGSYSKIVADKESAELAKWLNPLGITVFVLQYRLPVEWQTNALLADGQRAIRYIRKYAGDWGISPDRIGFLGCSAAGHLGAYLGSCFDKKTYESIDSLDKMSARPDFLVLLYPVISMDERYTHMESRNNLLGEHPKENMIQKYSPNLHVLPNSSPTFIVAADNDAKVPSINSALYYASLQQAGVKAELHIFQEGGHGFGIERMKGLPGSEWTELCHQWMIRNHILDDSL